MPNILDQNGLQTKTLSELVSELETKLKNIYGNDINLSPDTPDGQMLMIYAQETVDVLDLVKQVFSSFDPDNAIGVVLDQRVALNGVQRQEGTYTETNIVLVASQAVNLYGLNQTVQEVYTVADNAGNQWQLMETQSIPGAGTYNFTFRALNPGKVLTIPNTITVPVTIVLGIDSINNPTTYSVLGQDEESDYALRIRRQKSTALSSQGYYDGLVAALENVPGVISAQVYENKTSAVNPDGQPPHSIWVVVSGNATDENIAQAIYVKRNSGCDMFGDKAYTITQKDGSPFIVNWDEVESENVFIKIVASPIDGVTAINIDAIRNGLPELYIPGVYEKLNINDLATLVQELDDNALVTNSGFSLTAIGPFNNLIQPSSKKKQFVLTSENIIITPMQIFPSPLSILNGDTRQFIAKGGYGALTFTLDQNESGATISPTGFYESGATVPSTDIVRVTDSQGNFATSIVTVN